MCNFGRRNPTYRGFTPFIPGDGPHKAHPELRSDLFDRSPRATLLTEFLAATGRCARTATPCVFFETGRTWKVKKSIQGTSLGHRYIYLHKQSE